MYTECDLVEVCVKVPPAAATTLKELASLLCVGQCPVSSDGCIVVQDMPRSTRPGQMLKGLRLRADMTQKELAKEIGVPQGHISQYERNERKIPYQKAVALADVLETSVDDFLS